MVIIYAGPEKKPFIIHKEVACLYSPVLRAAFESSFVEGQTQKYNLEDVKPEVFNLFMQWLYGKKFTPCLSKAELDSIRPSANGRNIDIPTTKKLNEHIENLVYLWVTADYLQIPVLQNYIVDEIEHTRKEYGLIAYKSFGFLYDEVSPDACVRKILLEHSVRFLHPHAFMYGGALLPKQMLLDHIVEEKLARLQPLLPDPFSNREEFKRRFHVPDE